MRVIGIVLALLSLYATNAHSGDINEMRCPEGMVYVPPGKFVMGSNERKEEKPVRTIYVDAFYIDQYPVTNAQFKAFVDATDHRTLAEEEGALVYAPRPAGKRKGVWWKAPGGPGTTIEGRMDHPVVTVSYYDAKVYCEWAGKRLPTEAEWEKACRGTDGRMYPWGHAWKDGACNSQGVRTGRPQGTSPVGSYPYGASPYGAMDMVGNVWEWCSDEPISSASVEKTIDRLIDRVAKGGCWSDRFPRCSMRRSIYEKRPATNLGFRCAKDAQ